MKQKEFMEIHDGNKVTVYLVNGVKLEGTIYTGDNDVIVIERDGVEQMVFKHAIATILPKQKPNYDYDNPLNSGGNR